MFSEGKEYIIKVLFENKNLILIREGNDIAGIEDNNKKNNNKIWIYSPVEDGHGFINKESNKRIGRNRYENLKCEDSPDEKGTWQKLYLKRAGPIHYNFEMTIDNNKIPLYIVKDDDIWFSLNDRNKNGIAKFFIKEINS